MTASPPKKATTLSKEMAAALEPYLSYLTKVAFVKSVRVEVGDPTDHKTGTPLVLLKIDTTRGRRRLDVVLIRSHLDYVQAEGIALRSEQSEREILFCVPLVGAPMAAFLGARSVNFMDLVGNCRISLNPGLHFERLGRKSDRTSANKGWRQQGYWTLFALLAEPALLQARVRDLAERAGVSKTAAAETLTRLHSHRAIGVSKTPEFHPGQRAAWGNRWCAAYLDLLRPAAIAARFRTPDIDPISQERRIESVLREQTWCLGGAAGAHRLGTDHRTANTVLHVQAFDEPLRIALKALPAPDGPLIVIPVKAPAAYVGIRPHVACPLLLYAEIAAEAGPFDDRLRAAGDSLKSEHLPWL